MYFSWWGTEEESVGLDSRMPSPGVRTYMFHRDHSLIVGIAPQTTVSLRVLLYLYLCK